MNNKISFKLYAFLVCILISFTFYSQTEDFDCNFVLNSQYNNCDEEFSHLTDQGTLDSFDPVVFNIYFWELRRSNGLIDQDDNPNMDFEKEVLDVVAALNIFYNPFNVYFKFYGIDVIDNDGLYMMENNGEVLAYAYNNNILVPEAINVYIAPKTTGGEARLFDIRYGMSRGMFKWNTGASIHEVGHCFGLLHTHHSFLGIPSSTDPTCERVTRNITDPLYNADVAGDRVPDTAAAPDFRMEHYWELIDEGMDPGADWPYTINLYIEDCEYIGSGTDCDGNDYDIEPEDVQNIMSYAPSECKSVFTVGQAIRVLEAIEIDCYDKIFPAIRSDGFASFYEPYKGGYSETGEADPPLYQPGFDYAFFSCDCECPLPLDYGETGFTYNSNEQMGTFIGKYEADYSSITHPNHTAIDILQLNESQPWRCYDNDNLKPSGGTIIKFNDNVFNTNITLTIQDSLSINNENLIEELQPGLYNIIEQYNDGSTQENIIFKEN